MIYLNRTAFSIILASFLLLNIFALFQLIIFKIQMKITIFILPSIIGIIIGMLISFYLHRIKIKNDEKLLLYKETMKGVSHLLNNFITYFQIFEMRKGQVDEKTLRLLRHSIKETAEIVQQLNDLEEPNPSLIRKISLQNVQNIQDKRPDSGP